MSYDPSHSAVQAYTNTFGGAISAAGGTADAIHADGPFAPELPLTSTPISKKRKASKTKSSKQLSRSASTPQLSGNTNMSETDDKKRNKLGYQRISIACGKWDFPCRVSMALHVAMARMEGPNDRLTWFLCSHQLIVDGEKYDVSLQKEMLSSVVKTAFV